MAVPIVPKRVGEIEIEVTSILQVKIGGSYLNSAGDAVRRKLLVVVGICEFFNFVLSYLDRGGGGGGGRILPAVSSYLNYCFNI